MIDNLSHNQSDVLMYQSEDGQTRIDVRLEDETVWLSSSGQMAELFQKDKSGTINRAHPRNIYSEQKELESATATIAEICG